jgi:hypothetical protein
MKTNVVKARFASLSSPLGTRTHEPRRNERDVADPLAPAHGLGEACGAAAVELALTTRTEVMEPKDSVQCDRRPRCSRLRPTFQPRASGPVRLAKKLGVDLRQSYKLDRREKDAIRI